MAATGADARLCPAADAPVLAHADRRSVVDRMLVELSTLVGDDTFEVRSVRVEALVGP
jgi:hypothetical protein